MKLRGVNLGNWLSLEKWMQPELFEGIDAEDELDFFSQLSEQEACERLRKHYETYITEDDFSFWQMRNRKAATSDPIGSQRAALLDVPTISEQKKRVR